MPPILRTLNESNCHTFNTEHNQPSQPTTTTHTTFGSVALASYNGLRSLFNRCLGSRPPAPAPQERRSSLLQLDNALLQKIAGYSGNPLRALSKEFNQNTLALQCSSMQELFQAVATRHLITTLDVRFGDKAEEELPTSEEIQLVAKKMPHLTDIRISGKHVSNRLIQDIIKNFPDLQRLSITNSDLVDDEAVQSIGLNLRKLTALRFSSCSQISNAGMQRLRDSEATVRSLEVTECPKIDKGAFENISGTMQRVPLPRDPQRMGRRHYNRFVDSPVPSGLKNLTSLRASHFYKIDAVFAELRKINSKLCTEETGNRLLKATYFVNDNPGYCFIAAVMIALCVANILNNNNQFRVMHDCVAKMQGLFIKNI